jgi:hypothetical protein
MPSRNRKRKEALFRAGAAAAARVLGVASNTYACPLCGGLHGVESLKTGDLTLEHVPPQSMGGHAIVLTCRECNSGAGHRIDAAIAERKRVQGFRDMVEGRPTDVVTHARVALAGEVLNVITHRLDDDWNVIYVPPQSNDPAAVGRVSEYLNRITGEQDGEVLQLAMRPRHGFDARRARIGDLKTAYLLAFAALGYRWAVHPSLHVVRAQIAYPEATLLQRWWLAPVGDGEPLLSIARSCTEPPFACVSVRLAHSLVLLPWFDEGDLYARIKAADVPGATMDFRLATVRWPRGLELVLDSLAAEAFRGG